MTEERVAIQEREERRYPYDAVVVFSGGLKKTRGEFYPTDYRHSDPFGMLGAGIRIAAAVHFYLEGRAKTFVFTTGKTEKDKEALGDDVPSQAKIYREKFLRVLDGLKNRSDYQKKFEGLEEPSTFLDEESVTTLTNIPEALKLIKKRGWRKTAFLSSDYHISRISALTRQLLEQEKDLKMDIDFISAEKVVKEMVPGKYDEAIEKAYKTPEAEKRIASEEKGLQDLRKGRYARGEYQLRKTGAK